MRKRYIKIWLVGICLVSLFLIGGGFGQTIAIGQERVTLRFGTWGNPDIFKLYQEMISIFEKKNPDIAVKYEYAGWGQYWDRLQIQLAGGTAPDVFWVSAPYHARFAERKVIRDLSRPIAEDKLNLEEYFDVFSEDLTYGGKWFGLPADWSPVVLHYNKNEFDEVGLSYPDETWDWDVFLGACKKLTRDTDGDDKIDQWGLRPQNYIWYGPAFMTYEWGGEILDSTKTKCMLDESRAIEAFQFYVDLMFKHKIAPIPTVSKALEAIGDLFETGRAAMNLRWAPAKFAVYARLPFEFDIAPVPRGREGRTTIVAGHVWSIYNETEHFNEAWKFLKFLAGFECQTVIAQSRLMVPSLKVAAMTSEFLASPPEHMKVVIESAMYARGMSVTASSSEWERVLHTELDRVYLGEVSVEEALRAATKKIDKILAAE